jgi:hypothetical protein
MRKKMVSLLFLLVISVIICFNFNPVSAQELSIDRIEYYTNGADTILNITVTHISPSMPDQYNPLDFVDHLELEIDDAFPFILVDTTQYEVQHFSVQYNMGEVTGTPKIRARAVRLQGPGEWSDYVTIPEFSLIHIAPILAVISIAILLMKSKITAKHQSR